MHALLTGRDALIAGQVLRRLPPALDRSEERHCLFGGDGSYYRYASSRAARIRRLNPALR
jgi:hypothetical protein